MRRKVGLIQTFLNCWFFSLGLVLGRRVREKEKGCGKKKKSEKASPSTTDATVLSYQIPLEKVEKGEEQNEGRYDFY